MAGCPVKKSNKNRLKKKQTHELNNEASIKDSGNFKWFNLDPKQGSVSKFKRPFLFLKYVQKSSLKKKKETI